MALIEGIFDFFAYLFAGFGAGVVFVWIFTKGRIRVRHGEDELPLTKLLAGDIWKEEKAPKKEVVVEAILGDEFVESKKEKHIPMKQDGMLTGYETENKKDMEPIPEKHEPKKGRGTLIK